MANHQQSGMPPHTREVFEVLKQCAKDGGTIPYGKLATRVGGAGARAESVFPALNYIRDRVCLTRDLPWLWVLAVNQDSERPGPGAWRNTGVSLRDDDHWGEIVGRVYGRDWSKDKIEDKTKDE